MTSLELQVRSGARSGDVLKVREDRITVGRGPDATLRFDPERDLEVSALHAELYRRGGRWYVRDLGSRNGTWIDGRPLGGERPLEAGHRLRFGRNGPEVEVRLPEAAAAGPPPPTVGAESAPAAAKDTPSDRIRALRRRNRTLGRALAGGLLLATAAGAAVAWAWMGRAAAFHEERSALRSDMDSLLEASRRTIDALQGEMEVLGGVLRESQAEVRRLRSALATAELDGDDEGRVEDLRRQLQAATVALTRHQLAASLDFAAIDEANRPAVALVYVELEPGVVSMATAFAVRSDGTLITNRHAVRPGGNQDGEPLRIGVQFSDSPQVWPGRVVKVAPEADLAVLRIDRILGDVPTVRGFNEEADTLPAGSPVAVLGFPLGGDGAPEAVGRAVPRALLSAGVLQARRNGALEVVGYGDRGASGSPVLDARGRVVGVLFGGRDEDGTRTLLAVPADEVLRFLGDGR